MRLVIFTSNAIRHRFVANSLSKNVNKCLVVSEVNPSKSSISRKDNISLIDQHFLLRHETENKYFGKNNYFNTHTIPILKNEVNESFVFDIVKKFKPDLAAIYGSSIIREPLLSLFQSGKFINLHLGISPYYRGSGTNFWPFVNNELEYVGSTLLHVDTGVDTGDIIIHIRPRFIKSDTVHTVGCKVIIKSVKAMIKIIKKVENGEELNRVKQWKVQNEKYYKNKDFTKKVLKKYYKNLKDGLVKNYIKSKKEKIKLVHDI